MIMKVYKRVRSILDRDIVDIGKHIEIYSLDEVMIM